MEGFFGVFGELLLPTGSVTCPISSIFDARAGVILDPTFVKMLACMTSRVPTIVESVDDLTCRQEGDELRGELR